MIEHNEVMFSVSGSVGDLTNPYVPFINVKSNYHHISIFILICQLNGYDEVQIKS